MMIGQVVSHYKILEKLGEGGMGVVYKAIDTKLDRQVALKFLSLEWTREPDAKARFINEARAASALDHNNICNIHEIDETADGRLFIVMAFYEGETIREKIQRGPLKLEEAISLAIQITEGLEIAHQKAIVHRDLKPANVLVTERGVAKIVDFGLAKLADRSMLTKEGTTLGTVAYMSPEQARGEVVDQRTDIFSLGVLLYEMITGQQPFKGDYEQAVVYSIMCEDPEPVTGLRTGVPMELERILNKALAKNPNERYQHANEMRVDLRALQKTKVSSTLALQTAPTRSKSFVTIGVPAALILLIVAGVILFKGGKEHGSLGMDRKMLVVLPFENIGPPEDEYFAEGLTEELTSRLASVHGLGVISRTSAVQYKSSKKTSKQIGEELGVGYILEGTLRWDKEREGMSRVRVTPQLIRTSDDTHIWAEQYDRVIDQIFEVQSEVAEQVVKQLDIELMARERQTLRAQPTGNLEAYDYFLLGQKHNSRGFAASDEKEFEVAVQMFEKAIALDSDFAMAHVALSYVHSWVYFAGYDRTDERLSRAKAAIDRAQQIQPDLPYVQRALAFYYYRCFRDYDRAVQAFKTFRKAVPSSPPYLIGNIQRRQGKWEESLAAMEEAIALNPRNASWAFDLGGSYMALRRYHEADKWYDRALSLRPGYTDPTLYKYLNSMLWKGNADDLRTSLQIIRRSSEVNFSLHFINLMGGRFQEALAHVDSLADFIWRGPTLYLPKDLAFAQIYTLMGETVRATEHADRARILLEKAVQERPTDHRRYMALGLTFAFLGLKEEAMRSGEKAVELFPVSMDALYGPGYLVDLAWIYATLGRQEVAIEKLEYLLSIPAPISVPLLRIDPRWDSLRDHPRFQKLLTKYATAQ